MVWQNSKEQKRKEQEPPDSAARLKGRVKDQIGKEMRGKAMNHLGTQRIETKRLILRRFVIEDAEAMYQNWASDSAEESGLSVEFNSI